MRLALTASLLAFAAGAFAAPALAQGCAAHVEKVWIDQKAPKRHYISEATVMGPSCKHGVALLIIRQADGAPIYSWSGPVDFIFGLKDATTAKAMKTALAEWIDQGKKPDDTSTLPPWEQTEGQPKRAEFPFMPIEGTTKEYWADLKKEKAPMFCFPQGQESSKCAVLRPSLGPDLPDSMEEIGLQLFPG